MCEAAFDPSSVRSKCWSDVYLRSDPTLCLNVALQLRLGGVADAVGPLGVCGPQPLHLTQVQQERQLQKGASEKVWLQVHAETRELQETARGNWGCRTVQTEAAAPTTAGPLQLYSGTSIFTWRDGTSKCLVDCTRVLSGGVRQGRAPCCPSSPRCSSLPSHCRT